MREARLIVCPPDFNVTINEYSIFMNVAYRFLETIPHGRQIGFYPFIDSWSHHATTADMHREVTFPDRDIEASSVLLVEGDFTTEFQNYKNHFDFVVTHFFIDTARNLMNYLETIRDSLKPGGYWINSGPLLYGTGPWVQLSVEEIVSVAEDIGFDFVETSAMCGNYTLQGKTVRWMPGIYGSSERAINMNGYKVQFWVARRR